MCIFNRKLFECFALWSRLLIFFVSVSIDIPTVSYFSRALDVYVGLSMLGCSVCVYVELCVRLSISLSNANCVCELKYTRSLNANIFFFIACYFSLFAIDITRAAATAAAAAADEHHLYIEMYNFYLWNIDVCARFIFPFLININLSIISFVRIYVEF